MQPDEVYAFGAFMLGALHAFEPGHGKTVMAAYLVGTRGRPLDAIILGIVVTFTHTFTIILLAVGLTFAQERLLAAHTHVLMQIGAGSAVLAVGLWMVWRQLRAHAGGHAHGHAHVHSHAGHVHVHRECDRDTTRGDEEAAGGEEKSADDARRSGTGGLVAIGISGGLVPCPGAIAVLLAAVNRGQMTAGLVLTLLFSLGTASVLVAIGLVLVKASAWAERRFQDGIWQRWAPLASAVVVTLLGIALLAGSVLHVATPHDKTKESLDTTALPRSVPATGGASLAACLRYPRVLHCGGVVSRCRWPAYPHARPHWAQVVGRRLLGRCRGGAHVRVLRRMRRHADPRLHPRAARATREAGEREARGRRAAPSRMNGP
ncbi:MAG: sulfite exporter TauE/SafE family protein [Armatimonadota bacterium]|jgi:nickel/cobalt exporter